MGRPIPISLSGTNFYIANNVFVVSFLLRENPQDTIIVDVDKIYNEFVDEQIKAHRQQIGPDALQLKEFEINLRRYRIINGVYVLEYLEQPEQDTKLRSNYFLRTCFYLNL